jgi:hypothetical protein
MLYPRDMQTLTILDSETNGHSKLHLTLGDNTDKCEKSVLLLTSYVSTAHSIQTEKILNRRSYRAVVL